MTITEDQIKFYRSLYVNDTVMNGGRIGSSLMVNNSLNNLFRNIQSHERLSGIDLYRKFFLKNENPNDISLENPSICISNVSSGEDYFQITAGFDSDYQNDVLNYTNWYGSGYLNLDVVSGESSLDVRFKQASGLPVSTVLQLNDGFKSELIQINGSPSWIGSVATVTLSGELLNSFLKDETIVSAVMPMDNLTPLVENWFEISAAGVYDELTYPLNLYNLGTITESWTLTFLTSSTFSVSGAITGVIGAGAIDADFVPINGSSYYFGLKADGWSGSWIAGDTITFNTIHAAKALWAKESVPALANSLSNNLVQFKITGESE